MEFSKKLQKLRKEHNITQAQLAEKLYISRVAISKWESGRGYPNLDSLKDISKLFNISIDQLLSSEEIFNITTKDKLTFFNKIINLCYGLLDVIGLLFIFIPIYPYKIDNIVYSVPLIAHNDLSSIIQICNIISLSILTFIGVLEIILYFINTIQYQKIINILSISFETLCLLFLVISRQTYLSSFILILVIIKTVLLIKNVIHTHNIN